MTKRKIYILTRELDGEITYEAFSSKKKAKQRLIDICKTYESELDEDGHHAWEVENLLNVEATVRFNYTISQEVHYKILRLIIQ